MWSPSVIRVVIIFSTSTFSFLPGKGNSSRRPQQGQNVSAFLVVPSATRVKIITLESSSSRSIRNQSYRWERLRLGRTKRRTSRAMARALMNNDVTQVDVEKNSNSRGLNDGYNPDRDVESQAYQSSQGWTLKYHDIKTRRDAAEARAKVPCAGSLLDGLERLRS